MVWLGLIAGMAGTAVCLLLSVKRGELCVELSGMLDPGELCR